MTDVTPTREADFDAEWPYVLFDYYDDLVRAGEVSKEDAMKLYLADIATHDTSS